jgi:hypothetical protein
MTQEVTCSNPLCNHVLRVASGVSSPWLTCPRCLAKVVNTAALVRTDAQAVTPDRPTSSEPTCPACGEPIRGNWRLCPQCGESLGTWQAQWAGDNVEQQTHRDSSGSVAVGVFLALLVVLGLILFLVSGGLGLVLTGGPDVIAIFTVLFLIIILGVIAIARGTRSPTAHAVSGVFGGILVGGATVLLVIGLLCLSFIATFQQTCKGCK